MSARRIAREISVIILPQLPKDKSRLEQAEFDLLVCKSVQMLTDYARQCLSEVDGFILKGREQLLSMEVEHPDNRMVQEDVRPVKLTTVQLREQLDFLDMALHLVSEALDIPEMSLASDHTSGRLTCKSCGKPNTYLLKKAASEEVKSFVTRLLSCYLEHRKEVDDFIGQIKTKWRVERMVSIDRDILRLACTEAFFMTDIPINVAVSEAVELCHRFADERAAKFINGILGDLVEHAELFRSSECETAPAK